ncbi:MAG TPA: hypothetical protein VMU01_06845, partial [Rhizomicrobium sp.]|nr:hypothetical protein [Rhizomicrobium sp.]
MQRIDLGGNTMHFCRLVTRALCSAAFSVSLIAASPAQTPPSHPPVEAFGALPAISDVSLSPDGKHIAALQTYHGRTAVVIYEVGAPPGTVPAILIDEMHYIVGARWAKNDRLLVTIYEATRPNLSSTRTYPFLRMFSVDTKAQNPVMLLQNSQWTDYQNNTARIADLTLDDPENIIMPQFAAHLTYTSLDLYKVSVRTGRGELALQGKAMQNGMENTIYYIMDGHGHVVGRVDQIQEPLVDHLRINKDEYWQEVAQFDAETDHGADLVGMSVDGAQLVRFDTSDESGTTSVAGFEIATGRTVS